MKLKNIKYSLTVIIFMIFSLNSITVSATPIELLNDGGFENTASPQGTQLTWDPTAYGSWAIGDPMSTVGVDSGITPLQGSKMLRFDETGGTAIDLYQLVDVTGYSSQIDAGLASVDMSVFFNATATNTGMGLNLLGWNSTTNNFSGFVVLGGVGNSLTVDGDKNSWEAFSFNDILLTSGIRYLAFGLHDPIGVPTAYADNASLKLNITASIPEPSIVALMIPGLFGIGMLRRKV